MVLIQKLEEAIEDEIHDVKHYAKWAAELKKDYPALAQVLYTISTQEDAHQAMIHGEVAKIIEAYRKTNGEPPATMMSVYNYLHKRSIDKLAEARKYQDIYKTA